MSVTNKYLWLPFLAEITVFKVFLDGGVEFFSEIRQRVCSCISRLLKSGANFQVELVFQEVSGLVTVL